MLWSGKVIYVYLVSKYENLRPTLWAQVNLTKPGNLFMEVIIVKQHLWFFPSFLGWIDGLRDWGIDSFSHWFIYWFRLHVELAFEWRTKCISRTLSNCFIHLEYLEIRTLRRIAANSEASGKTAVLQIHQQLRIAGHLWWGLVLTNPKQWWSKWAMAVFVVEDSNPTQWYNNESL